MHIEIMEDSDDFDDAFGAFDEIPCLHCGEYIPEDVTRCPFCGETVMFATSQDGGRPSGCSVLSLLGVGVVALIWLMCSATTCRNNW